MKSDHARTNPAKADEPVYSPIARTFHWLTFLLIAAQIPVGFYMVWRGDATKFDAVTNQLYDWHKLGGMAILSLVSLRLLYRIGYGAPHDEPTLDLWQKGMAHLTHWGLYFLLIFVPVLGWYGVSYYGAREIFGWIYIPEIVTKNEAMSEIVLHWHQWAAILLTALVVMHIGAALYHYVIRRDGVLRRMLPMMGKLGK
ncbi:MAG: cytochrome b [Proteobacteria bacterium]|nr:cytochrome b [Pseudomonadota bacterium]